MIRIAQRLFIKHNACSIYNHKKYQKKIKLKWKKFYKLKKVLMKVLMILQNKKKLKSN